MKTWMAEAAVVGVVLLVVWSTHPSAREAIGSVGVLLAFMHAQVSDRLAEQEGQRRAPTVECYRMAARYFIAKEIAWVAYFLALRSYAALAGCAVFLAYPAWRRWWRTRRPLPVEESP